MGLNELIVRIGGDMDGLESMLDQLSRPFRRLQNTTRNFTSSVQSSFNRMSGNVRSSFQNMTSRLGNSVNRIRTTFGNMTSRLTNSMNNMTSSVRSRFQNMTSNIQNSVNNMTSRISGRMQRLRTSLNDALSGRNPAFNRFVLNCGRMSQSVQRFVSSGMRNLRTFGRGISTVASRIRGLAKEAGPKIMGLGQQLTTGLSLPITLAGGYIIKTAAEFETALSSIQAVTKLSGKEMKKVRGLAMEMGAKTKYSALEAAQGMEELLRAGLSVEQVMKGGLEGALSLATSGGIELAEAANMVSTALNTFKKDAMTAVQAADILTGADNASATSVGELKYALASCASVADGAGLSFMDTATALSYFGQNGLKGSDAGTSLKTMLMNLTPNTSKAAALFEQLNLVTVDTKKAFEWLSKSGLKPASQKIEDIRKAFGKLAEQMGDGKMGTKENEKAINTMLQQYSSSAFFDAKGNLKDLASIADLLRDRLKNMTPEKRMSTLKDMFGTDAYRAGQQLYNAAGKGIKAQAKAMMKVKSADVAKKKLENFNGAIENLKGSLETLAIDIGTPFLSSFAKLALMASDLVNAFGKAPGPVKSFAFVFGMVLAVIGPVVAAIGGIIAVFGTIAIPVGLAVAAISGLVAAFVIFAKKSGLLKDVQVKIKQIWFEIQKTFALIKPYIMQFISWVMPYITKNFAFFKTIIVLAMDNIFKVIKLVNALIKGDWSAAWTAIKGILSNVLKQIAAVIGWAMNSYKGILAVGWKLICAAAKIAWDILKQIVKSAFSALLNAIGKSIGSTVRWMASGWSKIKSSTATAWAGIKTVVIGAWNKIKSSTATAWASMKTAVANGVSRVKSAVYGMVSYIRNKLTSLASSAYSWGKNLISGFLKGIKSKIGAVQDAVSGVASTVGRFLECRSPAKDGPLSRLYKWGKGLTEGYAEGMMMNKKLISKASNNLALTAGVEMTRQPNYGTTQSNNNSLNYYQNGPVLNQQTIQQIANMLSRKLKTGGI